MSNKPEEVERNEESPDKVAIEGGLPLSAIDIESEKDMQSGRYHKLRSLHTWFAARPTPAARLAILGSVYPGDIDPDDLLQLMQIGPKRLESGITEYVERKFSESSGNNTLDEHYDYPNPNTQSPTEKELEKFHATLREEWGGELPTILDPTAGRGTIPFEALRYGLPAKANELNPVPSLILKVALEYAAEVGSLDSEIQKWRDEIHETAKKNIEPYFPTEEPDRRILNSAMTYIISCDACGGEIPLTGKWWLNKTSAGGDAIQPVYENGAVEYEHVKVQDVEDYDPLDAPVSRGDAECPHPDCGVVTETNEIRAKFREGDFKYSIYGVNYETSKGDWKFRAGSDIDSEGMEKAAKRVESDFEMVDFLTEQYPGGFTDRVENYGVEEWRDIFTPRQLVVHYEYLQAFKELKPVIKENYNPRKAEAILTILGLAASTSTNYSTRLNQWRDSRGYGSHLFTDNNFVLKKMGVDNNLSAPRRGYINHSDHVIESYEELVSHLPESNGADVASRDAASLTDQWNSESIDAAIVDPPYYSSIQYAELSDVFYIVQKRYLHDVHPELFESQLTDKDNEAVANPSRFNGLSDEENSKKELADRDYEEKMQEVFAEIHDLLTAGGVITVMFTHRDMDAWDTLTTAFINAGFTITATHPIKTEMSDRVGMQGKASADSSILLVGRKRDVDTDSSKALWSDVKADIQTTAENEARDILNSKYNVSKVDTIISAYGPTLQRYAEAHPVVDRKDEHIRPRDALAEARDAVTGVLSDVYLDSNGVNELDSLTRWYILSWLTYGNDTFPYDEGLQLGRGVGVDPDGVKKETKIWGKSGGDIQLKDHTDRVQDIIELRHADGDGPSSRKYPVNPTDERFTYTIDAIHSAIHVYEQDGPEGAWEWLSDRRLKNDNAFETGVTTLLEVLPEDNDMFETLTALISGKTGEYLDIDTEHIDFETGHQAEVEGWGDE